MAGAIAGAMEKGRALAMLNELRPAQPSRGGGLGFRPGWLDRRQRRSPRHASVVDRRSLGPEASVFALLLLIAATVGALWLAHRSGRFTDTAATTS